MIGYNIKISKDVDHCFSVQEPKYRLKKIDEDDEYNYFEGFREGTTKSQDLLFLINSYEVSNNFGNIVYIERSENLPQDHSLVIFMVNADTRFSGAMIVLDEDFDDIIIFMEDLETSEPKYREKLEKLGFQTGLKNFYRALYFPDNLLTDLHLKKEVPIILYENSVKQTIKFD